MRARPGSKSGRTRYSRQNLISTGILAEIAWSSQRKSSGNHAALSCLANPIMASLAMMKNSSLPVSPYASSRIEGTIRLANCNGAGAVFRSVAPNGTVNFQRT